MGTPPMPGIIIRLGRPRPPTQMNRHREKTKGAWRIPSSLEFDRGWRRAYRPTRGSGWALLTGWPKPLVDFGVWEARFSAIFEEWSRLAEDGRVHSITYYAAAGAARRASVSR